MQVDLCKVHHKQAEKLFRKRQGRSATQPPHPGGAGKGGTGRSKAGGLPVRAGRVVKHDYEMLKALFMKYAPAEPFPALALQKHLKVKNGIVFQTAKLLIAEGKLKSTGKGPGRRLTRV